MLSRYRRRRSSCGGLAALALLLLVVFDVPADAAVAGAKRRAGSGDNNSLSLSARSRRQSIVTSIAKLRSIVTPSAADLPGCVLFLNATSAAAAGCSSKPRRLRQDPPPTLPLVGGLPKEGKGGKGDVIAVLGAGDDAAALDLLLGNSSELSSRGVAGLVALPGPPPDGDWSPDDANPQV